MKNEVVSVVCGAMFGEERVNNSVDLLSRVLAAFSVGQISALVTATPTREPHDTVMQPSFHGTYCYALAVTDACMLSNVQSRMPRLLLFSRRTNTSSVLHALRAYV